MSNLKPTNHRGRQKDSMDLNAPWRDTPLDNWSRDTDPFIMSGDQWVDNDHDPGTTRRENLELLNGMQSPVMGPFMHPTHDTSWGNEVTEEDIS